MVSLPRVPTYRTCPLATACIPGSVYLSITDILEWGFHNSEGLLPSALYAVYITFEERMTIQPAWVAL